MLSSVVVIDGESAPRAFYRKAHLFGEKERSLARMQLVSLFPERHLQLTEEGGES